LLPAIAVAAICLLISAFVADSFGFRDSMFSGSGSGLASDSPRSTTGAASDDTPESAPDGTPDSTQDNTPNSTPFVLSGGPISELASFQSLMNRPERAAIFEWWNYCKSDEVQQDLEALGNSTPDLPMEYLTYGAYNRDMVEKLYEITGKYELGFLGEPGYDGRDLSAEEQRRIFSEGIANGPLFSDDSILYIGYRYECGTFSFYGWGGENDYEITMRQSRKGVMDNVLMLSGPLDSLTLKTSEFVVDDHAGWDYINAYGFPLLIMQNAVFGHSEIYVETETAIIRVGFSWKDAEHPLTREECERIADMIDFGQLK
jgi:hypothetical protein